MFLYLIYFSFLSLSQVAAYSFTASEKQYAQEQYGYLNTSYYYAKDFQKVADQEKSSQYTFNGLSGAKLTAYHLDRQSDTCVVVLPPFMGGFDVQSRYAGIYDAYDVVLVCCQWKIRSLFLSLLQNCKRSYLDFLFLDLVPAVQELYNELSERSYKQIVLAGCCYGGIVGAYTQHALEAEGKKGFDKLIFDSVPLSFQSLSENFYKDPVAVATSGAYYSYELIKWIVQRVPWRYSTTSLPYQFHFGEKVCRFRTPVCCIYCHNDALITYEQQETMKQFLKTTDSMLQFEGKHLYASLKEKELYTYYVRRFIDDELL